MLIKLLLLLPLAVGVIYYDVRFRRIPNILVLSALIAGLAINIGFHGTSGAFSSVAGLAVAFVPMLFLHVFGAMGAGDVKLFAAIGAVVGISLVPMTFALVVLMGGLLAIYSMVRSGTVLSTMHGVLRIFVGILPGWEMPRFTVPPDRRHTIPYGVAIMLGSLIALAVFPK
ncbi:MAG TPA: A24 family peptidase [Pyrinomonadaceae bacterium]|nr:A24 family peptidase [Pyrinomonadaceae bacterium]